MHELEAKAYTCLPERIAGIDLAWTSVGTSNPIRSISGKIIKLPPRKKNFPWKQFCTNGRARELRKNSKKTKINLGAGRREKSGGRGRRRRMKQRCRLPYSHAASSLLASGFEDHRPRRRRRPRRRLGFRQRRLATDVVPYLRALNRCGFVYRTNGPDWWNGPEPLIMKSSA